MNAGSRADAAYDLVIVGSGFAGSLLALIARRLGHSVLLLEKGRHPRFAIGESTSPLANLLLEQITHRYDLPRLLPLTTWGAWQRAYPDLGCGLKRGFTYYHLEAGCPYNSGAHGENCLMVAASPHDAVADTHWLRADVDALLVDEAIAAGAEYRDSVTLASPTFDAATGVSEIAGHQSDGVGSFTVQARLLVDATGPHGFLSRTLGVEDDTWTDYPATQALYSHFTGVERCDAMDAFRDLPATVADLPVAPYPPDDAALHHVFDGGWMWALRFGNGVTSAGIAVQDTLAHELNLAEGAPAWDRFLQRFPSIRAQFADSQTIRPFVHAPRLSYRAAQIAGAGWVLLPSAAAFIDPLFSTGIPLTLLGIERLGILLEDAWGTADWNARLGEYARVTRAEANTTADLIAACYDAMSCFPVFAALTMLYFAAASYGEMARRLERPAMAGGFLASAHPVFGPALRRCAALVRNHRRTSGASWTTDEIKAFEAEVTQTVAVLNVAGLCDPAKRNRYGVDMEDVVQNASKLGLSPAALRKIVRSAPWARIPKDG